MLQRRVQSHPAWSESAARAAYAYAGLCAGPNLPRTLSQSAAGSASARRRGRPAMTRKEKVAYFYDSEFPA